MTASIVSPSGAPATGPSTYEPPKGSSPFFGWIDTGGDPNSVKYEKILATFRDSRTGRFVIMVEGVQQVVPISDRDAERLMKRMGWTKEE